MRGAARKVDMLESVVREAVPASRAVGLNGAINIAILMRAARPCRQSEGTRRAAAGPARHAG